MAEKFVAINGARYPSGIGIGCSDVDHKPTDEEMSKVIESGNITHNLQSDVFYYLPDEGKICHAGIHATSTLFDTLPDKKKEITKIDDISGAEVLYWDKEDSKRHISKATVECDDPKIKEEIDKVIKLLGIEDDSSIAYEQYASLVKARKGDLIQRIIHESFEMELLRELGHEGRLLPIPPPRDVDIGQPQCKAQRGRLWLRKEL